MTGRLTAALRTEFSNEAEGSRHRYTLFVPNDSSWLDIVAEIYRDLRTQTRFPLSALTLNGIDVVDVDRIRQRLTETQVPERTTRTTSRHLAVERSDLAEVLLATLSEETHGYQYGYRSTRDRELVSLPGRGIDQIGVRRLEVGGLEVIDVCLGEAKVSSEGATPPRVVDANDDSLRNQHLAHLAEREHTGNKIWGASRHATDQETQSLLQLAASLWEEQCSDVLVVRCVSMLVRPSVGSEGDFGSHRDNPGDFEPAEIDFVILRLDDDDIETVIDDFVERARQLDAEQAEQ